MNSISPIRYGVTNYQNPNYSQNLKTAPSFEGNMTKKIFTNKIASLPIIASVLAFFGFSTKNKSVKPFSDENIVNRMIKADEYIAEQERNKAIKNADDKSEKATEDKAIKNADDKSEKPTENKASKKADNKSKKATEDKAIKNADDKSEKATGAKTEATEKLVMNKKTRMAFASLAAFLGIKGQVKKVNKNDDDNSTTAHYTGGSWIKISNKNNKFLDANAKNIRDTYCMDHYGNWRGDFAKIEFDDRRSWIVFDRTNNQVRGVQDYSGREIMYNDDGSVHLVRENFKPSPNAKEVVKDPCGILRYWVPIR